MEEISVWDSGARQPRKGPPNKIPLGYVAPDFAQPSSSSDAQPSYPEWMDSEDPWAYFVAPGDRALEDPTPVPEEDDRDVLHQLLLIQRMYHDD